jgi:hypothetical protein
MWFSSPHLGFDLRHRHVALKQCLPPCALRRGLQRERREPPPGTGACRFREHKACARHLSY